MHHSALLDGARLWLVSMAGGGRTAALCCCGKPPIVGVTAKLASCFR